MSTKTMDAQIVIPDGWRLVEYGQAICRSHFNFEVWIGGTAVWVAASPLMIGEKYNGRGIYICKTKGKK